MKKTLSKPQRILQNIALFSLTEFCKNNGIDCSGSYVIKSKIIKVEKSYIYELVRIETGETIATVTYSEHEAPFFRKIIN